MFQYDYDLFAAGGGSGGVRALRLALQLRFVLGVGATRLGLVGAPPE